MIQETYKIWEQLRELIVAKQYQKALQILPPMIWFRAPLELNLDIIALHIKCEKFNEAQTILTYCCDKAPGDHRLYGLQAQLDYCRGDYPKARKLYQELLSTAPREGKYWVNLAYSCAACEDLPAALQAFEKSLSLLDNPDARFYYNYGICLLLEKYPARALEAFHHCAQYYQNDSEFCFHYALSYDLCGFSEKALELYESNTQKWPQELRHWHNAAVLQYRLGNLHEAQKFLSGALALEPNHPIALPLSFAAAGKTPTQLPQLFVKMLFDQYAFNYDEHLKETLDYQAPMMARQILTEAYPTLTAGVVYDLGVGTGLLAPLVADIATCLIGFDISEGMLAQAKKKGFYQHLISARLPQDLGLCDKIPDYIFAIELSNYLGADLEPLIKRCSELLLPGGVLVLTCEQHALDEPYLWQKEARYSYAPSWVLKVCAQAGFNIVAQREAPLRSAHGKAVQGLYIVAEKNS